MKPNVVYALVSRFFLPLALVAMPMFEPLLAAAKSSPSLNCSVKATSAGFLYQLSRQPRSSRCHIYWESPNHTLIADSSNFHPGFAYNVTNQSILMKHCEEQLSHKVSCPPGVSWEETTCTVNCSSLLAPEHVPATETGNWRLDKLTAGFIVAVAVAIILVLIICYCIWRHRRRRFVTLTASYSVVDQQIKTVINMV